MTKRKQAKKKKANTSPNKLTPEQWAKYLALYAAAKDTYGGRVPYGWIQRELLPLIEQETEQHVTAVAVDYQYKNNWPPKTEESEE